MKNTKKSLNFLTSVENSIKKLYRGNIQISSWKEHEKKRKRRRSKKKEKIRKKKWNNSVYTLLREIVKQKIAKVAKVAKIRKKLFNNLCIYLHSVL